MMFAETLPPPTSAQAVGWLILSIAALCVAVNQIMKLVRTMKGPPAEPANPQLGQAMIELGRRVTGLEEWRDALVMQMAKDKSDILRAGEERGVKIHEHIERERDELQRKIDVLPDRVISTLRNAQAIKP